MSRSMVECHVTQLYALPSWKSTGSKTLRFVCTSFEFDLEKFNRRNLETRSLSQVERHLRCDLASFHMRRISMSVLFRAGRYHF